MKLAFREFGEGTPLIILHGLFGQSDNWNTLAKNFGEKGFHVFTIDQRNHGLSPHSTTWDYDAMAADLDEFIGERHLDKPVLLGHSMGGKSVMFYEKNYPGKAGKLIIADIAAKEYPAHHEEVLQALHAVNFETIENRKQAEEILNRYIQDFGTRQFLLKNIYWKDDAGKKMGWRFNLEVISKEYDNVRVPVPVFSSNVQTLVIKGSKSHYITEKDIEDFRKRFPNSRFVVIENAGHWVHAEKPKEFLEAVLEFISP